MIHLHSKSYMADRTRACIYHISIAKVENSTHAKSGTYPIARSSTSLGKRIRNFVHMHEVCFGAKGGPITRRTEGRDRFRNLDIEMAGKRDFLKLAHERRRELANRYVTLCTSIHKTIRQSGAPSGAKLTDEIRLAQDGVRQRFEELGLQSTNPATTASEPALNSVHSSQLNCRQHKSAQKCRECTVEQRKVRKSTPHGLELPSLMSDCSTMRQTRAKQIRNFVHTSVTCKPQKARWEQAKSQGRDRFGVKTVPAHSRGQAQTNLQIRCVQQRAADESVVVILAVHQTPASVKIAHVQRVQSVQHEPSESADSPAAELQAPLLRSRSRLLISHRHLCDCAAAHSKHGARQHKARNQAATKQRQTELRPCATEFASRRCSMIATGEHCLVEDTGSTTATRGAARTARGGENTSGAQHSTNGTNPPHCVHLVAMSSKRVRDRMSNRQQ